MWSELLATSTYFWYNKERYLVGENVVHICFDSLTLGKKKILNIKHYLPWHYPDDQQEDVF